MCSSLARDSIVVWIKKHTGSPVRTVSSKEEAEEIVKQGKTTVVGFFKGFEVMSQHIIPSWFVCTHHLSWVI
jgi:hypothetical protein